MTPKRSIPDVAVLVFSFLFFPDLVCAQDPGLGLPAPSKNAWSVQMAESFIARNRDSISYPDSKRPERWDYEQGVILEALKQVWKAGGDERYLEYLRRSIDRFVEDDGSIRTYEFTSYNLDNINTGRQVLFLFERTGLLKYRAASETLRFQLRQHPRTLGGGFWHKKIYPYQMWLDGIYMAEPFYARCSAMFGDTAAFEDIAHQIIEIERRTRDPKTGLLYHGWDESHHQRWADTATGCSPHFWGRAMGWYAMGIVDVLDVFPSNHPKRPALLSVFKRVIDAVAAYQDAESGVWYQVLDQADRKGNYKEASCTAMFVYAIAKGVRMGYLDRSARAIAERGFEGMIDEFVTKDADGLPNLNHVCSVSGLGGNPFRDGSFEYYVGEPQRTNDLKGVGPFILAAVELGK